MRRFHQPNQRTRSDIVSRRIGYGVLAVVALGVILFLTGVIRRPRPMFHNTYTLLADHPPWPTWGYANFNHNLRGELYYSDYADNALVVSANGRPGMTRDFRLGFGMDSARFGPFGPSRDRWVTLKRTQDVLLLIRPDGNSVMFHLRPGSAEQFDREHQIRDARMLEREYLSDVRSVIEDPDLDRFDAFVRGYESPAPLKDTQPYAPPK